VTAIEWTDETWNPTVGCSRVSEGCRNCYAERQAFRNEAMGWDRYQGLTKKVGREIRWTGVVRLVPSVLAKPLSWRKPRRVFVNSMSDLFHESLPDETIAAVFGVMASAPRHTFQILTKRPARMAEFLRQGDPPIAYVQAARRAGVEVGWPVVEYGRIKETPVPLANVWLGVSVEDQATADERIPLLLQTHAAVRFVSYEPALGPVDFRLFLPCRTCEGDGSVPVVGGGAACPACFDYAAGSPHRGPYLDWIIVGGESGPGGRPFDAAWARSTIAQCRAACVPVFVKQMGRWILGDHEGFRPNHFLLSDGRGWVPPLLPSRWYRPKEAIGFSLWDTKGGDMAEWPEDLRVREFPA
jgi:protein gp37